MKRIIDIREPLWQGVLQATECVAEDQCRYVVKHSRASAGALIKEWLAGRIGRAMGLPIPPIEILELPAVQAKYMAHRDAASLSKYPAFGSQWIDDASLLLPANRLSIPAPLRAKILLFDWWILNGDRTERNPNVLWVAHRKTAYGIDHHLAFDEVEACSLWADHLFRDDRDLWDDAFKAEMQPLMAEQRRLFDSYWNELPTDWLAQQNENVPDRAMVDRILGRFETDPERFWGEP